MFNLAHTRDHLAQTREYITKINFKCETETAQNKKIWILSTNLSKRLLLKEGKHRNRKMITVQNFK